MSMQRLELSSSHQDATLANILYVVHGSSSGFEAASILNGGLRFTEGRPTVSTNIVHAQDWTVNAQKQVQSLGGGAITGDPGSVIVCAVPTNFHVGYGVFTTAYIDRALKRVTGAPLRYAAARKQLSFYTPTDTEAARKHIEAEVTNGYGLNQHPQFTLDIRYLIGSFDGPALMQLVKQLDVSVKAFEFIGSSQFERALHDLFRPRVPANAILASSAIHCVVIGTIESIVISRLRMMRWQGLALLGFGFFEGEQEIQVIPVKDMAEQGARIDDMERRLASTSLFGQELSWLKVYVAHALGLMRVELEDAEFEPLG